MTDSRLSVPESSIRLQIVSFDWPWPPNYGGAIDVYNRIEALLKAGANIDLHIVANPERETLEAPSHWPQDRLNVTYYKRKGIRALLSRKPFIVSSRQVSHLLSNLAAGPSTILFEGIHCSALIGSRRLSNHVQWIRMHNIEAEYYQRLAKNSKSLIRRLFFKREAKLLAKYEMPCLRMADLLLPISRVDQLIVGKEKSLLQTPYAIEENEIRCHAKKDYVLFHAGLHVEDNINGALLLLKCAQRLPKERFIIAGRSPSDELVSAVSKLKNAQLIADPSGDKMTTLIQEAKTIFIYSKEPAGFKVKLLTSLCFGSRIIASQEAIQSAPVLAKAAKALGLLKCCTTEKDVVTLLEELAQTPVYEDEPALKALLNPFTTEVLAKKLLDKVKETTFTKN